MDEALKQRFLTARKALIAGEFAFLNPEQRQAVMTTEGPLLLLAGAGSGKTTVLIHRIVNLIRYGCAAESEEVPEDLTEADVALLEAGASEAARKRAAVDPVAPWRILAITFTNKAADELKNRLEKALGETALDIWAQTFHSACVRILRRDAERLGYSRSFTIYDSNDSQTLMKKILRDRRLDEKLYPPRWVLSIISGAKDELLGPDELAAREAHSYDARRKEAAELYREYQRRLREADAMDFDDLIRNTVQLLQEYEDVRSFYQRKFQYVLVDEYQDTNNLQYLLASTLAAGYENICVVGDDDQSIYRFRGATIRNILEFEQQYKNARVIRLERNYRSTGHILDAANAVIRNNRHRKGKQLWTEREAGEKPVLYAAANEHEEAQYVADRILEDAAKGIPLREHAVLYRMNAQSNQLEYAFKRSGIAYRVYGGMKFFDRAEVKDMLAYLSVLANPTDDLRLARIINVPARGIGSTSIERAGELARERNQPLYEIVRHADAYPELQRAAPRMLEFVALLEELRARSATEPLDALYDRLLERTGYIRALQEKDTPENAARIENIGELKSNILSFIRESGDSSLHGFLDEVALYTDLDNMDAEAADSVVMMTIHSSKGLEFPTVFLVGMEENIFPGTRSIGNPEELEEERRLAYVAITRAERKLYLTCARERMLFGRTSSNRPSRFIEEIPPEHLDAGAGIPERKPPQPRTQTPVRRQPQRSYIRPVITPATASAPIPDFQPGDAVRHKSFGEGVIRTMTPMGGDFLVEIEFAEAGRKRLMLKAAARMLQKQ